jgi:hypothetical protein
VKNYLTEVTSQHIHRQKRPQKSISDKSTRLRTILRISYIAIGQAQNIRAATVVILHFRHDHFCARSHFWLTSPAVCINPLGIALAEYDKKNFNFHVKASA